MPTRWILPLLLGAAPAMAFEPPQGCSGVLTVQMRNCQIEHVWQCEGDAKGDQWIGLFDDRGPLQLRKVDREFQWLESYFSRPASVEFMETPAPDPENLTELFASGEDLFDFTIVGKGESYRLRYQGFDRLTGETVTIDGEPLLRTLFSYQVMTEGGEILSSRMGNQYVSEKHRLFFFGTAWNAGDDPSTASDDGPMEFIYPGEPGFFANLPKFGCGEVLS